MLKKNFLGGIEYATFQKNELEINSLSLLIDSGLNNTFSFLSTSHKAINPLNKRCLLTNRRGVTIKNFSVLKPILKKTMATG